MNWSVLVTFAIIIGATLHYAIRARNTFEGPVGRIKRGQEDETIPMESFKHIGKHVIATKAE